MNRALKLAIQEFNDANRMFEYSISPQEIDLAITLIHAAEIKIKAFKNSTVDISELEPISEVY
jgi:hypothetical protein